MAYRDVQRALRDERFKLIRYPRMNKTQLFDLQQDPDEIHNLADDARNVGRVASMMTALRRWQRQVGDSCELTSEEPLDPTFVPPAEPSPVPPKRRASAESNQ